MSMTNEGNGGSWRRDSALPFQRMDEETIVVDPRSREVHLLNGTGARIWDLLEAPSSVDELCQALDDEFDGADPAELRREVQTFLADLSAKGLVAVRGRA
jgi:PqqD family protein of HPr-rel-A system